ncbi:GDSL esterase/lipase At2g24560-like [Lycium ferocissimum]|uniref:GDSL esterase/lipase At2g24560-like n=1 Tax=Lycium ferocissimum TaxID=112874 RepID=UPI0028160BFF|nr:GDSL esterase/lipase At2g24560-like [Lycium ferocissimum]
MALQAIFFFTFFLWSDIITSQTLMPNITSTLIFGDSTMDTGNNNYIFTLVKANHPPYGKDYPNHASTGRFSNGKLVPDILACLLNLKQDGVPPYLQPNLSTNELLTGINFASAGSGYDELTSIITSTISMTKQLRYFKEYLEKIKGVVGEIEAERIVKSALVIISCGTNDFIFNFYDVPTRRIQFSMSEYQDFLLDKLQFFVKELYDLGCRMMLVNGLPPIGCLPVQMTAKSPLRGTCIENENSDSQIYNQKLKELLVQLQAQFAGSKMLYADSYTPLLDLINNPQEYGFVETNRGCCGSGLVEAGPLCTRFSPVCSNTSEYVFFDSVHPTEAACIKLIEYLVKDFFSQFSSIPSP